MVEGGDGLLTGSGTLEWSIPELPDRAGQIVDAPAMPDLSWPSSAPTGPSVRQPSTVLAAPNPVQYTPTTRPPAGQPGVDGFSYGTFTDTAWQPPDPWVAVGPDHVIRTVNKAVQILDRSGNLIQSASLEGLLQYFGCRWERQCPRDFRLAAPALGHDRSQLGL